MPLPGASVVVQVGDAVKAATSTDADGKFTITFSPNATYHIAAELTAFTRAERDLTLAAPPCDTTRRLRPVSEAQTRGGRATAGSGTRAGRGEAAAEPTQPGQAAGQRLAASGATGTESDGGWPASPRRTWSRWRRRRRGGRGGQRFQTLTVETDATGAAALEAAPPDDGGDVARLLPPGFSAETAQADAIAINGSGDATNLDRGLLNDRQQAIRLGEFDPATGQFAQGFGPAAGQGPGGRRWRAAVRRTGRAAAGGGGGGRGGGRGGFVLGGRGARGQSPYQGSTTYTFGGSALDTPPYQLRPDVPVTQPQFSQNNFGAHVRRPVEDSGPVRGHESPHELPAQLHRQSVEQRVRSIRDRADRRDADRRFLEQRHSAGRSEDRPAVRRQPDSGEPHRSERRRRCCGYIPTPNLPGTTQNYHVSTTSHSTLGQLQPAAHAESLADGRAGRPRRRRRRRGGSADRAAAAGPADAADAAAAARTSC